MLSDIEIARAATLKPITEIAGRLNIPDESVLSYGHTIAKLDGEYLNSLSSKPRGKLVLVSAITPTPAGEGKTTTTVGLGDAFNRIGKKAVICLREPSLGPCFGVKGGAAGGGYAQVVPMERINLHFTGDFHAITSAHDLLAAMIDNHVHWGNEPVMDRNSITFRRVIDMNDRMLRNMVIGLGGKANGYPREGGFDISVASEVMAILCLASDLKDLRSRLERIIIGEDNDHNPVAAAKIKAAGAMTALLKDALQPNLVQTLEGNPALIHGGPFANIAHGCNSLIATKAALHLGDIAITEAGFGADLGAEKFFDIKCRQANLEPDAVVLVATIRALKMHGGVALADLKNENIAALETGFANLARHAENLAKFGVKTVVAINRFHSDTEAELDKLQDLCASIGLDSAVCTHFTDGGAGAEDLARKLSAILDAPKEDSFRLLYPDEMPLWKKIETIAKEIYRAGEVVPQGTVLKKLKSFEEQGFGDLPVCIAKTQSSFSADPKAKNAPTGHIFPIREVRLNAGAGFIVAISGNIMTMPGLPRHPAAENIDINEDNEIIGLA
ncbi:formate--tetrahydrofolate ligase [Zymomonas mobilis subsp. mobilis ZM4 = ATCC 31821]|uniref:Formate--tetrahydrofolate ligase n=2 Tax=Zymomonas mobilis TaxID=542 RepID=FTHS_ZYMMO|nr:formate--tetrahydrofolate ligase [Zymomonas mobilis]Q5NQC7.3 RecName: Full=Formate--tetrahydrofolate ligase; AltName: Full=Formyltetrahydrofolate synthetase; Short=FHS; Short=FTHFS [Zymomonas mobilis subsp. mobilis ZM4 = ATCC 31821]AAV89078.2 Formate--tetrahydrofolate ligase [Zymomonas mobilis subsp. mobilis ZM4 = ATCC 31821]AVZ25424.1 formate--tetrahydrofolate ligase [Zymomonas mobilis subsp. mobilis]AVZ27315.1 formate--tetrahydrofolate ligase [Zymomonas mobilis subsp. mobilis]AVZ41761.1 f